MNPCWQTCPPVWHNQGVSETSPYQDRRRRNATGKPRAPRPPLNGQALDQLALHYVGKYATSRARLVQYLRRKIGERGWDGTADPDPDAIAARFAELGYIDDAAFAEGRARSLGGRGYGRNRVHQALRAAGIEDADAQGARAIADAGRWAAALRHAEKKRIGPWAREEPDRAAVQKAIASLLRAGHDFATARAIGGARPGMVPDDGSS